MEFSILRDTNGSQEKSINELLDKVWPQLKDVQAPSCYTVGKGIITSLRKEKEIPSAGTKSRKKQRAAATKTWINDMAGWLVADDFRVRFLPLSRPQHSNLFLSVAWWNGRKTHLFILPSGTLNFLAETNQINGDSPQFLWFSRLGFWKSKGNQSRKLGHLFTSQLFVYRHPCVYTLVG